MSPDGSVAVGTFGLRYTSQAIAWVSTGSKSVLGVLPDNTDSIAFGVSATGAAIVGSSSVNFNPDTVQAFRWTASTGITGLGFVTGGNWSSASAVSSDGNIIAGTSGSLSVNGAPPTFSQAARWSAADNAWTGLGYLSGNTALQRSFGSGISDDGSTIVGASSSPNAQPSPQSSSQNSFIGTEAFRWAQSTGLLGLGDLPGASSVVSLRAPLPMAPLLLGQGTPILLRALKKPSAGPKRVAYKVWAF